MSAPRSHATVIQDVVALTGGHPHVDNAVAHNPSHFTCCLLGCTNEMAHGSNDALAHYI